MKLSWNKFLVGIKWYIVSTAILFLSAIFLENYFIDKEYDKADTKKIQRIIIEKEKVLEEGFDRIIEMIPVKPDSCCLYTIFEDKYFQLYEEEGLIYLYYRNGELAFWTDNIIPVPIEFNDYPDSKIVNFSNSVFYSKSAEIDNGILIGLIQIKTEFPYENKFLSNGFRKEFKIDSNVKLIVDEDSDLQAVYNFKEEYLFSLDYMHTVKSNNLNGIIAIILYILSFVAFLFLIRRCVHFSPDKTRNIFVIISSVLILILFRVFSYFRFPDIIYGLNIFNSFEIHNPKFLPPIGEIFAVCLILFFIIYNFYIDFHFSIKKVKKHVHLSDFIVVLYILIALILYFLSASVFRVLILNSNISFETYKVFDLSVFTFIGFGILALMFASFVVFVDKFLILFKRAGQQRRALIYLIIIVAIILSSSFINGSSYLSYEASIFYSIICFLLFYYRFFSKSGYHLSSFVIYVLLFSLFTLWEVNKFSGEKNIAEMKMTAVNLSTEHDPIAELLFIDLEKEIKMDEEILSILFSPGFDIDLLYNTVERKYFKGFWDKYDLQITVCSEKDSVFVSPSEEAWYSCYPFFYETVLKDGIIVPRTTAYYLDNLNGRISYLLPIIYQPEDEEEVTMFLELDSRLVMEGLGYPGLLLEESLQENQSEYSNAKYNSQQLITSSGEFNYSTVIGVYTEKNSGFEEFQFDGFDHIAYHLDHENTIVVSKKSILWVDLLISFSYIFGFYFLSLFVISQFSRISPLRLSLVFNFKTKIQWGMNSVLFFSFILIGAGTVYFSINQYRTKQYEILEEKVQSVYVELIHKLEFENDLRNWSSESYFNLNELLMKFSNVFYTDINLYDSKGYLLASSRPEIFQIGLISTRMNALAFKEMTIKKRSEFVQSETVGTLDYLSVYVPFVNADNQLLAYLNLPYFTRQDALTGEITNLVVAIINIVVLLSLLSFTIAVFMANAITMPLKLLQQKFAHISLSEKNEAIYYKGNDEIGSLVKEYNLMVSKLQDSVELLSKSERELAWREMAKQIAHEIKNPLTPMKLNIQHLARTVEENPEEIKKQVQKISNVLIEQIDNLSSIATEFSNFAKMPQTKSEIFDLEKKLKNAMELFTDYERCILSLKMESLEPLFVLADREQISRVFINLIKNAIQAIPINSKGRIDIKIEKIKNKALVSIRDNGKGIPEEIRGKLFHPNFTTKTSGMGLGLAIVKGIIQDVGGEIYFETKLGKGSVFYVELPIFEKES